MPVARRRLLQASTLLAALPPLRSHAANAAVSAAANDEPIWVVGAGMAGLSAAQALQAAGRRVRVIEARDRVGGRLWSDHNWPDATLDLGASWIHGTQDNPVAALAQGLHLRTAVTQYDNVAMFTPNGQAVSESAQRELDRLSAQISHTLKQVQQRDTDQSLQQAMAPLLERYRGQPLQQQRLRFLLNSLYEQEYSGGLQELSALWLDSDKPFDGPDALFPDGYDAIPKALSDHLDLLLNSPVDRVETTPTGVTLHSGQQRHRGSHAIVTLPLGVLKSSSVRWSPELPPGHRQAITQLGMGLLNKCFFRFPQAFWPTDADWIEHIAAQHGHWTEWINLSRVAGQPILLGFLAADRAREMEHWSDAAITEDAMGVLRALFGPRIPKPVATRITRWGQDPWTMGSYSFNAVGSTPAQRDTLSQPIGQRLFFAGEATERQSFGTVHGAWLSGQRAAQQVLHAPR